MCDPQRGATTECYDSEIQKSQDTVKYACFALDYSRKCTFRGQFDRGLQDELQDLKIYSLVSETACSVGNCI